MNAGARSLVITRGPLRARPSGTFPSQTSDMEILNRRPIRDPDDETGNPHEILRIKSGVRQTEKS
jgi:hypothetical protein